MQVAPANGRAELQAPPNYDGLTQELASLQQLIQQDQARAGALIQSVQEIAETNPGAFGTVTGVPIAGSEFLDEVPGKGSSRYLYCVRAVDTAGNASDWSGAARRSLR